MTGDPVSDDDIIETLTNEPGIDMETLLRRLRLRSRTKRLHVRYRQVDRLLTEGRVSIMRYTTFAPCIQTTFMLFATANGRLEIIDNKPMDFAGHQIGHVHDPLGLYDIRMEASLADD